LGLFICSGDDEKRKEANNGKMKLDQPGENGKESAGKDDVCVIKEVKVEEKSNNNDTIATENTTSGNLAGNGERSMERNTVDDRPHENHCREVDGSKSFFVDMRNVVSNVSNAISSIEMECTKLRTMLDYVNNKINDYEDNIAKDKRCTEKKYKNKGNSDSSHLKNENSSAPTSKKAKLSNTCSKTSKISNPSVGCPTKEKVDSVISLHKKSRVNPAAETSTITTPTTLTKPTTQTKPLTLTKPTAQTNPPTAQTNPTTQITPAAQAEPTTPTTQTKTNKKRPKTTKAAKPIQINTKKLKREKNNKKEKNKQKKKEKKHKRKRKTKKTNIQK
jgi:hypothetical protein